MLGFTPYAQWPVPDGFQRVDWGEVKISEEVFLLAMRINQDDEVESYGSGPYRVLSPGVLFDIQTQVMIQEPGDGRLLRRKKES